MLGSPLDFVDPVSDGELTPTRATGPAATTSELIGARFREARNAPDWGWNQSRQMNDARIEISEALRKRGYDISNYDVTAAQLGHRREDNGETLNFLTRMAPDADRAMWAAFGRERARDPNFLPDYAGVNDLAGLTQHIIGRRKQEVANAEDVIGRGSGASNVISYTGALGAGLLDPTSYVPIGGGATEGLTVARQILKVGAKEAIANMAVTAATEPLVRSDAAQLGQDRTLGDFGYDLLLSGTLGATIGTTVKGAEIGAKLLPEAIFPHLPKSMQERAYARALEAGTIDDRAGVAAIRAATSPAQAEMRLTPDEVAAMARVEAHADIRESSPFMPTPSGDLSHGQRLAAAIDALLADRPLDLPAVKGPSLRADLLSTTAAPIPAASSDATLAGKIIGRESGGNASARAATSSASGLGQFTDATWLSLYRRRIGGADLSNAQILALKTDPTIGRQMTQIAVGEHKAWLRAAGQPITDGNVYLMHFLGPKALDVLRADPHAPIASILPESWIRANEKVLRGRTAGDVIGWADRRMGGVGAVARAAEDAPLLRPEMFETPEEHVRATAELERESPRETIVDQPPAEPVTRPTVAPAAADAAAEAVPIASPPDALQHVPAMLDYISKRSNSLDITKMSAALGIDPETAQRAAGIIAARRDSPILVAQSRVLRDAKTGEALGLAGTAGRIMRKPQLKGPLDLLTQIAAWGGVADNEGHALRRDMGLKRKMTKAGPVVRANGMSIDELGERLHEAKWFSQEDRPSEADVLDLLDRATRSPEKIFHPEEMRGAEAPSPDHVAIENAIYEASKNWGIEMDQELMDGAADWVSRGMDPDEALLAAIREQFDAAQAADALSLHGPDYDIESIELASREEARGWIDPLEQYADHAVDGGGDAARGFGESAGQADGPGTARLLGSDEPQSGGGTGEARGSAIAAAERLRPFDDPIDGAGSKTQADSIEHDLRMELEQAKDPAIAERQRQQAQLGAAAPLRKPVEQDGTMGLGLFDAADQPEFRLDDGGDRTIGDILDGIDQEQRGIDAIEACMRPKGGGDGAG